jgi:hypothetical protein
MTSIGVPLEHIMDIIHTMARDKMRRIHTISNIARMPYHHAFWDWALVMDVRPAVGKIFTPL